MARSRLSARSHSYFESGRPRPAGRGGPTPGLDQDVFPGWSGPRRRELGLAILRARPATHIYAPMRAAFRLAVGTARAPSEPGRPARASPQTELRSLWRIVLAICMVRPPRQLQSHPVRSRPLGCRPLATTRLLVMSTSELASHELQGKAIRTAPGPGPRVKASDCERIGAFGRVERQGVVTRQRSGCPGHRTRAGPRRRSAPRPGAGRDYRHACGSGPEPVDSAASRSWRTGKGRSRCRG